MADGNGGNGGLYFIVGALCVAVAVGAFLMFHGGGVGPGRDGAGGVVLYGYSMGGLMAMTGDANSGPVRKPVKWSSA